ncbi:hypothetical protein T07_3810 [Trichinella nelsoni]|uniref:Uncharacterized protein n=1 Tax=Trichinella nelsoni TaxID=6336 RepID=A0A0V0REH9_9BILA|nr:hypothetical protein T07_3810 [Trichinella nelsoni]
MRKDEKKGDLIKQSARGLTKSLAKHHPVDHGRRAAIDLEISSTKVYESRSVARMSTRRRQRANETDKAQSDGRRIGADQDADPPAPPGGSLHREKKSFPPFPSKGKPFHNRQEFDNDMLMNGNKY